MVLILPQGNEEEPFQQMCIRVPNDVHSSHYAKVVFCHFPLSTFNILIYPCLHPAAEEASDLVVAMVTVLLVFKRSSEDGRTRTRSVGCICRRVSLSCHCPLKSPFASLCVPSALQRAEECGLLAPASSLSSSDPGRVGRVRGGVEESRNPLCGPSEKCP